MTNNNVQNVKFLRNGSLFPDHAAALTGINTEFGNATIASDGTAILARYGSGTGVKTLVGIIYYVDADNKSLTILDVEGASAEVDALRNEINAKLGDITSANTVSNQLTALSGNAQSSSAETSVAGAKAYAKDYTDEQIGGLDYTGVTTGDGVYVTNVTETDGVISATTATLPTVDDTAVDLNFVTAVDQTNGQIAISRGEITSSNKTISLSANTDGGVDFKANVDGTTIIIDENTGKMSVASSALVQYEGDDDTIQIGAVSDGKRIVSSPLTIQKVTTGLSEEVKEEYHLIGHSGNTIGDPVKIYKDSHIVSITYITDSGDTHYQNLEYQYIDASGNTQTTYVDMSELVLEAEFASGLTIENHVARGVVDSTSETFLTVGADGFKLSGVQDAINAAVNDLDADISGNSTHVTVGVVEENGEITAVTVSESNIANADDLAELSGKTITAITSTNGSITASIDDAVGNKTYNIETDASKIKMSGFTSTDVLSGITPASSITEAFEEVDKVITENEQTTAAALTDLDDRIKTVSGDVETLSAQVQTLESSGISGITVNGNAVTVANNIAPLVINSATGATASNVSNAIIVQTDANGNVTLGLNSIDCGYYA